MIARPQPICDSFESAFWEKRALPAHLFFGNLEEAVEAHPTIASGFVPLAGADFQPGVVKRVLRIGGDKQPHHRGAGAADDQNGALARWRLLAFGGHPHPDHLARIGLAVHIGGKKYGAGVGSGGLNPDIGGLAGLVEFIRPI